MVSQNESFSGASKLPVVQMSTERTSAKPSAKLLRRFQNSDCEMDDRPQSLNGKYMWPRPMLVLASKKNCRPVMSLRTLFSSSFLPNPSSFAKSGARSFTTFEPTRASNAFTSA